MKINILGTGIVGQTLAAQLAGKEHAVTVGTRDVEATMARTGPDRMGNPPFSEWLEAHDAVKLATLADAAAGAELVMNALNGDATLAALDATGAENLAAKPLLDLSNPLDFSHGWPPSLSIANTDSLGEQIQNHFPDAKVVKSLNTVTAGLMLEPDALAEGDHTVFVAGNDADAKRTVTELLQSFGWSDVVDLGDITGARAAEMLLPAYVRLVDALGTPRVQFKIAR